MVQMQFADVPSAFEAGRQIGRQRQQENALAKAAKSFGAGDYKTASNDLFQYAPDLAMKTANYGQQQQTQQARMQAGTMAASGDLKGAAGTLAGQGDLEGWASLDGAQRERVKGMYDYGARVLYGLQNVPMEQRKAAALAAARNSPYADILVPQTEQEEDWSDARLQAGIAGAMSVSDMIKANTDQAKLDQGERRLDILEYNATKPSAASMPKLSKDYRYKADGSGEAEVIPGSETDKKWQAKKDKADAMRRMITTASSNVLASIKTAREIATKSPMTTGLIGEWTKGINQEGQDLAKAIDTVVANIGFDRLTEMRQASPTGGALGAVTERELALLQSTIASLAQSQSQKQLLDNLQRVEAQYLRAMREINDAYMQDFGDEGGDAAPAPEDPLGIR